MRSIALIDYGSGNLRSAEKALIRANAGLSTPCEIHTTDDPHLIARADGDKSKRAMERLTAVRATARTTGPEPETASEMAAETNPEEG